MTVERHKSPRLLCVSGSQISCVGLFAPFLLACVLPLLLNCYCCCSKHLHSFPYPKTWWQPWHKDSSLPFPTVLPPLLPSSVTANCSSSTHWATFQETLSLESNLSPLAFPPWNQLMPSPSPQFPLKKGIASSTLWMKRCLSLGIWAPQSLWSYQLISADIDR